jgi:hypothetical protein
MTLDTAVDEDQQLTSAYVGPIEPEIPELKHPRDVLRGIGVEQFRNPLREWEKTGTNRS